MRAGKILAASHEGVYVIRLCGDVRVNLCTTIEDYLQAMYLDPAFKTVWIDLCDAEGVDSTTLGVLAKLALHVKKAFGFKPLLYASNPGIVRLLYSMSMQSLFDIREKACATPEGIKDLPVVSGSSDDVKSTVIEAHEVLMSLSDENQERFRDLVSALDRN